MSKGPNIHAGHRERMRERVRKEGLASLQPHEALEVMLYSCIPQANTNPIAHALLKKFGCLASVIEASEDELMTVDGIGPNAAFFITALRQFNDIYQIDRQGARPALLTQAQTQDYLRSVFSTIHEEEFHVICLNNNMQIKSRERIAKGSRYNVDANALDVMSYIGKAKPSNVIFVHNHPGGTVTPSRDDLETTAKLYKLLRDFGVKLIDHYIVTTSHEISLNMLGYDLSTGEMREITGSYEPEHIPKQEKKVKQKAQSKPMRAQKNPSPGLEGEGDLHEFEGADEYGLLSDYTYGYPDISWNE